MFDNWFIMLVWCRSKAFFVKQNNNYNVIASTIVPQRRHAVRERINSAFNYVKFANTNLRHSQIIQTHDSIEQQTKVSRHIHAEYVYNIHYRSIDCKVRWDMFPYCRLYCPHNKATGLVFSKAAGQKAVQQRMRIFVK